MEITLKNISVNERLSEETTCFAATLYINGVRAGETSNRGHGGNTLYQAFDGQGIKLIREAERYCEGLPDKISPGMGIDGSDLAVKMSLEGLIDDIVTAHLVKKDLIQFNRKIAKKAQDGIVVGIPDKNFRVWRMKVPINQFMGSDRTKEMLRKFIVDKVVPDLKEGEMILNDNLPADFVKMLKIGADRLVPHRKSVSGDSSDDEELKSIRQGRKSGR